MEVYNVTLIYPNSTKHVQVSEHDAITKGNIYNVIGQDARNLLGLQRIEVEVKNDSTGSKYTTLTYDRQFEAWRESHARIERVNNDGTRDRFYIGKSTGWVPCYLEIKRKDSSGGAPLWHNQAIFTVV